MIINRKITKLGIGPSGHDHLVVSDKKLCYRICKTFYFFNLYSPYCIVCPSVGYFNRTINNYFFIIIIRNQSFVTTCSINIIENYIFMVNSSPNINLISRVYNRYSTRNGQKWSAEITCIRVIS